MSADDRTEAYPVELILPYGRARLVPGMAVYVMDGLPIDVDVEVPEDLAARGWFWWGSELYQRLVPGGPGISIATGTYPPPGIEAPRGTCFDAARVVEVTHASIVAMRQVEATKKPAKKQRRAVPAAPVALDPEQMVMELL